MSMHLLGPQYTTTNYRKKKTKVTQGKMDMWMQQYRERCKMNKRYRLPQITFEEFVDELHGRVKHKREFKPYTPAPDPVMQSIREHREKYPSAGFGETSPNACAKPEAKVYTGTLIKGVAVTHKSNIVPVMNQEQAEDIARMRR